MMFRTASMAESAATRDHSLKTAVYTGAAMTAFAANSVICRTALESPTIDAASFSAIRLASGALVLAVVVRMRGAGGYSKRRGSWASAVMLFLYAVAFSFAYIDLTTGTGALILFGGGESSIRSGLPGTIFLEPRPWPFWSAWPRCRASSFPTKVCCWQWCPAR
jgi:hypothetical protein